MSTKAMVSYATSAVFGFILFVLFVAPTQADEPSGTLEPVELRIGFTQSCFTGVNQNDAEAAFKVFILTVGRKYGYEIYSKTTIFNDDAQFEKAIKDKSVNLVIVDSWKFLEMNVSKYVKPAYITSDQGRIGNKYLLLSRRGGYVNSLADLRGRQMLRFEAANAGAGIFWFESLLESKNLGAANSFLSGVETVTKPSAAILPVFFGKKDACLVTQSSFEVMRELNPQLGKELQEIASSDRLADVIVGLSHDDWTSEKGKADLVKALGELHQEPAGQQILSLFKINQLIPFEEFHLESVQNLRALYDKHPKGVKR